jgi:hypothetical protein
MAHKETPDGMLYKGHEIEINCRELEVGGWQVEFAIVFHRGGGTDVTPMLTDITKPTRDEAEATAVSMAKHYIDRSPAT